MLRMDKIQLPLVQATNPMQDFELMSPPDDSICCLEFSPPTLQQMYLVAGGWDNNVRCWEVERSTGKSVAKGIQTMQGAVLDVCWSDDGSKIFIASSDKTAKVWDVGSNKTMQVGHHDLPIKTCHWIKAPNYSCLMTGSWDKTVKLWDTRSANPIRTFTTPERVYCADVQYPLAVVGTDRHLVIFNLEGDPSQFKSIESPLRFQQRCVSIFKNKQGHPVGYAVGSIEGRVAFQSVNPISASTNDNYSFKCHRVAHPIVYGPDEVISVVHDVKFHPVQTSTLATGGSDGRFCYWDKDERKRLTVSKKMEKPVSCLAFSSDGTAFAYAVSYDWTRGHVANTDKTNRIFIRPCLKDLQVPKP